MIDYFNNMKCGDRSSDRITDISIFSHGATDSIWLGFDYTNHDIKLDFAKSQVKDIDRNAFDNPFAQFYACNTGTGDYSFAQAWVDNVGGKALAVAPKAGESKAKTDYTKINEHRPISYAVSRHFNGFSLFGSANLPIASSTGTLRMFYPSVLYYEWERH